MVELQFDDKGLTAQLDQIASGLKRPRGLAVVLGREVRNRLRSHFIGKQRTEPNRLGGKRTNFWRAVANAVHQPEIDAAGTQIRVAVAHPAIAQKVFGGRLTPKRAKALTIPVSKEAYGRTAATLEADKGILLFVLGKRDGQQRAVLAELSTTKGVVVHYVLAPWVDQKPDPDALPSKEELSETITTRAQAYVSRLKGGVA